MTAECILLVNAVKASVTGQRMSLEGEPDWQSFVRLVQAHRLEALAYDGLQKNNIPLPNAVQQYLSTAYMQAIFRDSQFEYMKAKLSEKLVEAGVEHIFLKGAVLKYSYPEPALRTMCDLDILVRTEDYPTLDKIALELGGKAGLGDGNHRNFLFPGGVAVEFHPNLLHHSSPVGAQINPGWQYARKDLPTCAGEMTPEGFYLNTICHLANHFVSGGVGVRFVLDVWVNRHLCKAEMDRSFVEKELMSFDLMEFAKNIEDLAEYWFGDGEVTPVLEELAEYILTSGSHGISDRAILNAVTLSPGQSQRSALLKKAFHSREELEDRFPWCKGKPWLLPAAWCTRAYRAVTNHGHLIVKWSKGTGKIDKEQIRTQSQLLSRFGIRTKH